MIVMNTSSKISAFSYYVFYVQYLDPRSYSGNWSLFHCDQYLV